MKFQLPKIKKKIDTKKEHAKRYLLKYIKELKVHFDLSENQIKDIMKDIYYSKTFLYKMSRKIQKYIKEKR